jgi:hypothetical protein
MTSEADIYLSDNIAAVFTEFLPEDAAHSERTTKKC